ncbi:MAG: hypothetical protein K2X86_00610 [Cytophagaceae bacterium]|nr:hypothetical protein [Cytophagaceae bacterium]
MKYVIIEKSILARIAAFILRGKSVAIVFGKRISLSGVSKEDFLKDSRWLKHELVHIKQYERYGFFRFIFLYLIESIRKGYYNNKFEAEARREAEK